MSSRYVDWRAHGKAAALLAQEGTQAREDEIDRLAYFFKYPEDSAPFSGAPSLPMSCETGITEP